jgi:hypothetical protein
MGVYPQRRTGMMIDLSLASNTRSQRAFVNGRKSMARSRPETATRSGSEMTVTPFVSSCTKSSRPENASLKKADALLPITAPAKFVCDVGERATTLRRYKLLAVRVNSAPGECLTWSVVAGRACFTCANAAPTLRSVSPTSSSSPRPSSP